MTPTEKGRRVDALNQGPDTRRVLCEMVANREGDLEELKAENVTLRQQLADATESMGRVEGRCAKLRELVEDMLDCIDIQIAFERVPARWMQDEFAGRARELGIEVDE